MFDPNLVDGSRRDRDAMGELGPDGRVETKKCLPLMAHFSRIPMIEHV